MLENLLIYGILFCIGFIEEFIAIIYYGFVRKGKSWKKQIATITMIRNVIWWIAIIIGAFTSLFEFKTFQDSLPSISLKVLAHTVGVGIGAYLSIEFEENIHKRILNLKKGRGKKKSWWFISGERKK